MKASEIRNLTDSELREKENELAEQLFTLRLQASTGQLERPAKVREARKDLARVLTVLRERQAG
ncbi:MAG: 50S ribosomal protein L29 [Acidobacteria bacterium]|nr:MAG: 50S ribosomal protein L29 [Acidobacteriota bacterium]REK07129.1 MAG: 50S ribosomal protein L29 [Acidobacteriota bacterium]